MVYTQHHLILNFNHSQKNYFNLFCDCVGLCLRNDCRHGDGIAAPVEIQSELTIAECGEIDLLKIIVDYFFKRNSLVFVRENPHVQASWASFVRVEHKCFLLVQLDASIEILKARVETVVMVVDAEQVDFGRIDNTRLERAAVDGLIVPFDKDAQQAGLHGKVGDVVFVVIELVDKRANIGVHVRGFDFNVEVAFQVVWRDYFEQGWLVLDSCIQAWAVGYWQV